MLFEKAQSGIGCSSYADYGWNLVKHKEPDLFEGAG
jgi:hypothetical protein